MTSDRHASGREFRIWVDGRLSDRFADGLAGVDQRDDTAGTVLSGDYVDESHLQGLLDQLRGLGIAVRRFEVDDRDARQASMAAATAECEKLPRGMAAKPSVVERS